MALVHAGLQDREAPFEWLGHALRARDEHLMYLGVDPKWDAYRDDSRMSVLIAQCGINPATDLVAEWQRRPQGDIVEAAGNWAGEGKMGQVRLSITGHAPNDDG
jgi:hypothetical protein